MNEQLLKILNGKTEFYPSVLEEKFPRVFSKILESIKTNHLEACLLDLMVDNSGGTRQGFPPEAAAEIIRLGNYLNSLQAKKDNSNAWNSIPELKRHEIARLGFGFTPQDFLKAIDNDSKDAVHVFISCGIDLEVKDERGWTALMIAVANGNEELTNLLIRCGARLIARDINGFTPLHWAAFNGMAKVVELLISKEADVNSQSKFGWTPLMQACTRGHLGICAILLASGAKVDLANSDGASALKIAESKGFQEIAELLLSKGAESKTTANGGDASLKLAGE